MFGFVEALQLSCVCVQIEMEDVDDGEAEPEENVPLTETHSKRLAIMNLQWDRIKVRARDCELALLTWLV